MQSRRYRDTSRAVRTLAAIAVVVAGASFGAPGEAAAQGAALIQDTGSTPNASTQNKRRVGTPQLGASPSAQKRQPQGFIDTLLQGPRLTTTTPEPADWVRRTRPPEGAPPPPAAAPAAPARPRLTPDEVRRREAAREAARIRHDRLAGRKTQGGRTAPAPASEQKAETAKPGCVMTCAEPIGVPRRR